MRIPTVLTQRHQGGVSSAETAAWAYKRVVIASGCQVGSWKYWTQGAWVRNVRLAIAKGSQKKRKQLMVGSFAAEKGLGKRQHAIGREVRCEPLVSQGKSVWDEAFTIRGYVGGCQSQENFRHSPRLRTHAQRSVVGAGIRRIPGTVGPSAPGAKARETGVCLNAYIQSSANQKARSRDARSGARFPF